MAEEREQEHPQGSPALEAIYLRYMFDLLAQEPGDHLHWGLWRNLPRRVESFGDAQQAFADHIASLLAPDAEVVLDVGCGLGGLARQLGGAGKQVIAITPIAEHAAALSAAAFPGVEVRCTTFEEFGDVRVDAVLFAESLNFFADDLPSLVERCRGALRPGGQVIAADIVTPRTARALTQARGFEVTHRQDITDDVAYTAAVLGKLVARRVVPARRMILDTLRAMDPELGHRAAAALSRVPNEALALLLEGRPAEDSMLVDRRYETFVLRKGVAAQDQA